MRTIRLATVVVPMLPLAQLCAACSQPESTDPLDTPAPVESSTQAAADSPVAAYLGTYHFVGGDREVQARDDAIEDVIADMNIISKAIARDKIKDTNPIAKMLKVEQRGNLLTISPDARSYTAALDGSVAKVKSITGDPMDLTLQIGPDLEQRFSSEGRLKINHYKLSGSRLVISVTVKADALPKPLQYDVTYEKD